MYPVVLLLFLFLVILWLQLIRHNSKPRLRPGPRRFPLIGNLFSIPTSKPWLTYSAWRRQYGDLIFLDGLGMHILVINSMDSVTDLLEKRSSIYSDRPDLPVADLTGWGDAHLAFLRYGDQWRVHRRMFHSRFRKETAFRDQELVLRKCREFMCHLLESPDMFAEHAEHLMSAIILSITYGYDALAHDDPLLTVAKAATTIVNETLISSSQLINLFPSLSLIPKWMPGASFKRQALKAQEELQKMMNIPFDMVKADMAADTVNPSWMFDLLDQQENIEPGISKLDKEELFKSVGVASFAAAVESTSVTIRVFTQAMVLYPEVQRRAQADIDAVLGGRLPCFEDKESLPYITALIRELRRWRPVLPLLVPHTSVTDDTYKGHFLPKGTVILANAWEICHDSSIYDQPDLFIPERFLDASGNLTKDTIPTFGFGRRICVGRYLAEAILWITITSTLATFDIAKAKDETGREIPVSADDYTHGVVTAPSPFECSITPRSEHWRSTILAEKNEHH